MTIKETLSKGVVMLKSNNVDNPVLKARLLLEHVLKQSRQYLIVYDNKEITKKQEVMFFLFINKLIKGVPLQHITRFSRIYENEFYS